MGIQERHFTHERMSHRLAIAVRGPERRGRAAAAAGVVGTAIATRAALAAWCDRYNITPSLRSPLLPTASIPYTQVTLPLWRNALRIPRWSGPKVHVVSRSFGNDPNIRVRVTTPAGPARPRPAVIWLHSGGMISGSSQFEGPTAGFLARAIDAVVIAPDYRLAPEEPFPAALDDCVNTVKWVLARAEQLGVDPHRIAVAGASAGGGLTANCVARCNDEGIEISAQALLYPMLDDRTALRPCPAAPAWSATSNAFAWSSYLGHVPHLDPAPRYAAASRREDLGSSPPTWIAVGDIDILHEESREYAKRLQDAGVPCEFVAVGGMYHAADLLVPWARPVRQLYSSLAEHLRCHLAAPTYP